MTDLTVLLGGAESDLIVVEDLKDISRHGLLRPFLVLRPDFQCVLIENGDVRNVGVLEEYAAGKMLHRIRVIRLSLDGAPVDQVHTAYLANLRGEFGQFVENLEYGTLTVLPRDATAVPEAFVAEFQFNLLIEPRDMAGEAAFTPTFMTRERQVAMATAAIAAIGGLWTWMEEAPFQLFETGFDGMGARVSLMRLTTRVVDAGDVTARSVAWALARGGQRPAPPGTTRHNNPEEYLREFLSQISPTRSASPLGLSMTPPEPYLPPQRRPMKLFAAIAYFFRSLAEELKKLPQELIRRKIDELKGRIEAAVQNATFGADSAIKVEFAEPSTFDQVAAVSGRLSRLERIPGLELGSLPSSPATWDQLGTMLHGVSDGTEFPERLKQLEPEWDGKRAVITELTLVASPEGRPFYVVESDLAEIEGFADRPFSVRSYDVMAARALDSRLRAGDQIVVEIPTDESAEQGESADLEQNDDAANTAEQPTAETILAETVGRTDEAAGKEGDNSALAGRFAAWRSTRSQTLLWKLGERLVDDQVRAAELFASTESELESLISELEAESEQSEKRRKKFIRRAVLLIVCLVVLLTVAVVGFLVATAIAEIVAAVCLLGIGIGFLIAGILRLGRDRVRDRHRIEDLMTRDRHLAEVRRHSAGELHRLTGMYDQYLDWAEIFGSSIHEPWGSLDTLSVSPWRTTTGALSFVCGEPFITDEGEMKAALATAQRIAKRGWIRDAYLQRRADWVSAYQSLTMNLNESGDDPESDNRQGSSRLVALAARDGREEREVFSPRVHFCLDYIAGDRSERFRDRFLRELRDEAESDTREHLVDSVLCDNEGLSGRSIDEFTSPIVTWDRIPNFNQQLTPSGKADHTITVHSVGGITDPSKFDIPEDIKMLEVCIPGDRSLTASFRMDVTSPLKLEQTRLVDTGSDEAVDGFDEPDPEPDVPGSKYE